MRKFVTILMTVIISLSFAQTWESQTLPGDISLGVFNSVKFIDANTGWIAGRDGFNKAVVLHTIDGSTWNTQFIRESADLLYFEKLFMFTNNKGWVVATKDYGYYDSALLMTSDGGDSWTEVVSDTSGYDIKDLFFVNENIGWLFYVKDITVDFETESHYILEKTSDGGSTWETVFDNTNEEFSGAYEFKMFFSDADNGWSLRENFYSEKSVWKTTDGGATWSQVSITLESEDQLSDLFFIDANTGWVCGLNGTVYHTANAGDNWELQYNLGGGAGKAFASIKFINENIGYVCGANGRIRKTINGGSEWTEEFNGYSDFFDICLPDATTGYAIGTGIFKYSGSTDVEDINVNNFKLSAGNYPNPFNPSTTFTFSLPSSKYITLEIYNIQGKLVDKKDFKNVVQGTYYYQWDASEYPSGNYYYVLKINKQSITGKCLLLK